MKRIVLAAIFAASLPGPAHELDSDLASDYPTQLGRDLPQTVVVRRNFQEPTKVEVLHLKEKLRAGNKLDNKRFYQIAANAERTLPYDSTNELDRTTSTSSWLFGLAIGLGIIAGATLLTTAAYGTFYSPSYYRRYYPYYSYAGYYYPCTSYYSYAYYPYNYSYYGCGY